MCGRHEIGDTRPEFMPDAMLWRLLQDLVVNKSAISTIVPFLNGDPLEDPRIFDVIDFIAEEIGLYKIHFSTNASLLEGKTADKLKDALVSGFLQGLSFSVDGYNNFEKVRTGLKRNKIYKNVGDFLASVEDHSRINIHFTAVQENLGDIEDFVNYWKDYRWTIMPADGRSKISTDGQPRLQSSERPNPIPCWQLLWSNVYIMTDGTFVPCCVDCVGASKLGSLKRNTIGEVFTSQVYNDFRQKHLQIKKHELGACRTCLTHY